MGVCHFVAANAVRGIGHKKRPGSLPASSRSAVGATHYFTISVDLLPDDTAVSNDHTRTADNNAGTANPDASTPAPVVTPAMAVPTAVLPASMVAALPPPISPALTGIRSGGKRRRRNECRNAAYEQFFHGIYSSS